MAQAGRGGGNTALAFIVGAILVVLVVVGWMAWSGRAVVPTDEVNVEIDLPKVPAPKVPEVPKLPEPQPLPVPDPGTPG